MLTKIEAMSAQGALLSLPLEDIINGLLLESVDGLDPVKATIVSSSFAQQDGTQYQSSRREDRNIKLRIGLEPDYVTETVRDLRKRVYSAFMPKSAVDLKFYLSDDNPLFTTGRVESCETPLFTAEPAVDVSIICFDPDFYDPIEVKVSGTTTAGSTETKVTYDGSVESGLKLQLRPNRTITAFTVYHRAPDGSLRSLDFSAPLQSGDVLDISTVPGEKGAWLTRASSQSSILYGIAPESTWLELLPGDNYFRVYATGAAIPFDIMFTNKYGGL